MWEVQTKKIRQIGEDKICRTIVVASFILFRLLSDFSRIRFAVDCSTRLHSSIVETALFL